jgi:hypothetical protein
MLLVPQSVPNRMGLFAPSLALTPEYFSEKIESFKVSELAKEVCTKIYNFSAEIAAAADPAPP